MYTFPRLTFYARSSHALVHHSLIDMQSPYDQSFHQHERSYGCDTSPQSPRVISCAAASTSLVLVHLLSLPLHMYDTRAQHWRSTTDTATNVRKHIKHVCNGNTMRMLDEGGGALRTCCTQRSRASPQTSGRTLVSSRKPPCYLRNVTLYINPNAGFFCCLSSTACDCMSTITVRYHTVVRAISCQPSLCGTTPRGTDESTL